MVKLTGFSIFSVWVVIVALTLSVSEILLLLKEVLVSLMFVVLIVVIFFHIGKDVIVYWTVSYSCFVSAVLFALGSVTLLFPTLAVKFVANYLETVVNGVVIVKIDSDFGATAEVLVMFLTV